jgi:hypothetical protein
MRVSCVDAQSIGTVDQSTVPGHKAELVVFSQPCVLPAGQNPSRGIIAIADEGPTIADRHVASIKVITSSVFLPIVALGDEIVPQSSEENSELRLFVWKPVKRAPKGKPGPWVSSCLSIARTAVLMDVIISNSWSFAANCRLLKFMVGAPMKYEEMFSHSRTATPPAEFKLAETLNLEMGITFTRDKMNHCSEKRYSPVLD